MRYILLYALCLFVTSCSRDVSEAPEGTESDNWLPVLTRAAVGTEATIAGFSLETSTTAAFSENVRCENEEKNIWKWQDISVSPSLTDITLLTASIPPIDMSRATTTLTQDALSDGYYSKGLQLGFAPAEQRAINVHHCLARLDLDCEGTYTLNRSIYLYLASSAEVDFRTATIKTSSNKAPHSQSLENNRRIVLTILPQTFKKGDILFQYWNGNTQYTYRLERDLEVSTNQCLKVRISRGEEDEYTKPDEPPTPPDPPIVTVSITASTSITEWVTGSDSEVSAE